MLFKRKELKKQRKIRLGKKMECIVFHHHHHHHPSTMERANMITIKRNKRSPKSPNQ